MGREAPCEMLALKETSESGSDTYSRCSVIEAPPEMPDGLYTVAFGECAVAARKEAGLWLPNGTATNLKLEQGSRDAQSKERSEASEQTRPNHKDVA